MWKNYLKIRSGSSGLRAEWAAIKLTQDGQFIVGIHPRQQDMHFLHFKNADELKAAIQAKKLCVKKWVIDIPRHLCILKPFHLPATDLNEATKMLEFELPSLLPFPPDQLVYGCTELPKHGAVLDVLVCLAKIEKVNACLNPFLSTGIELSKIVLSSLAIYSEYCRQIVDLSAGPSIVMSTNTKKCEIATYNDGNLHHAHGLSFPTEDISVSTQKIAREMLHQHRSLPSSLQDEALFVLGGPLDWTSQVQHYLLAESSEEFTNRIRICKSHKNPDGIDDDKYSHDTTVVAGLLDIVNRQSYSHFNLLPREFLKQQIRKAQRLNYLHTGGLAFTLFFMMWLCLLGMNWRIERKCNRMEADIAPIKKLAGTIETKRRQIKALQTQLTSRGLITQILQEFHTFTPENISLSELNYVSDRNSEVVKIKGQADILSNAFGYTEAMRKASLLNCIQIDDAQQISRPGGSVVEFRATCLIKEKKQ